MPRATCRCGQSLNIPEEKDARVVCPKCGARVKVRQRESFAPTATPPPAPSDGFIRFFCPCGRRLKVDAVRPPSHGKCPDCGRVVPVPDQGGSPPAGNPETPTEELSSSDLASLDRWSRGHLSRASDAAGDAATTDVVTQPPPAPVSDRAEVGLRVCPTCGKPVHLGAETCRDCGTPVPRR